MLSDFSHQQAALRPDRLLRLSRWLFQLRRAQQAKLPFFLCRPTKSTSRVRLAAAPPTRQFAASARTAHHYSPKTESNSLAARSPPAPRTLSPPSPRNWVPTPAEPPPVEITDDAATGPPRASTRLRTHPVNTVPTRDPLFKGRSPPSGAARCTLRRLSLELEINQLPLNRRLPLLPQPTKPLNHHANTDFK